ncbi:MAG: hypothetical protein AAGC47_07690 [Bacteroidota bacterium]
MSEEDEILDFTKKPGQKINVFWLYGVALALFFYWFLSGYLFWPFGEPALFCGMVILIIAAVIRLGRSEDNRMTSYSYFVGRIVLIAGVFLHIQGYPQARYFLWVSFAFFGLGLAALYFLKRS